MIVVILEAKLNESMHLLYIGGKLGTEVSTARLDHVSPQAVCRDARLMQLSPSSFYLTSSTYAPLGKSGRAPDAVL